MRRFLTTLTIMLLAFTAAPAAGPASPRPADEILNAALQQARASHRGVFVIFHASWCKWCHRLDAALTTPDVRKILEKYYVMTGLDVLERGGKIDSLENPGGGEVLRKFGSENAGLPWYVVLDGQGKPLGDSNMMPGRTNIGFPGAKEEVAAFGKLLKQTAPRMTPLERETVLKSLGVTS